MNGHTPVMNQRGRTSHLRKSISLIRSFVRRGMIHCNLQVLYHCNFRCAICDFWKDQYHDAPVLSVEHTRVIAKQLASLGSLVISIGGGEPLLHPQIVGITEILARRHFPMMITNGFTATPELARELFRAGMYEVSVSLDYRDAQRHDAQRGRAGAHERALAALEVFHRARTHHIVAQVAANDNTVIKIMPPLIVSREMLDRLVAALDAVFSGAGFVGAVVELARAAWDNR